MGRKKKKALKEIERARQRIAQAREKEMTDMIDHPHPLLGAMSVNIDENDLKHTNPDLTKKGERSLRHIRSRNLADDFIPDFNPFKPKGE